MVTVETKAADKGNANKALTAQFNRRKEAINAAAKGADAARQARQK
ncbi:hypothetical protein PV405_34415 [Streptomyces sp. ME02-6979-3A]|nr:hypothetical protein [Streptomyces sp. ME02-6979-3A]MDX3329691.1 hypothetical protein [Streptomyces sp. ME02-6979-3A]